MQGDVSREDLIFGSKVLAVFLVFVLALGYVITRIKNWRFERAWTPLVPALKNAKITGGGGGAATSWLSGTYRDSKVYARMTPNVGKYSGDSSGIKANVFSAAVQAVPGKTEWSLEWKGRIPGLVSGAWTVDSKDPLLQARLEGSALVALVSPLGEARLRYSATQRELVWTADIEPEIILPPDQFRRTLDTLLEVVCINTSINS